MTVSSPQDAWITASKRLLRYRIPLAIALVANCIMIARVPLGEMLASDTPVRDVTRRQCTVQPSMPQSESHANPMVKPAPATSGLRTAHDQPMVPPSLATGVAKPVESPTVRRPAEHLHSGSLPPDSTTVVLAPAVPAAHPAPVGPGPDTSSQVDRTKPMETAKTPDVHDMADQLGRSLRMGVVRFQKRVALQMARWTDHSVAIATHLPAWLPQEPKQPTVTKQPNTAPAHLRASTDASAEALVSRPESGREDATAPDVPSKQTQQMARSQRQAEFHWGVRNPAKNGGQVVFMVDGKVYSLAPGQSRRFSTTGKKTVRFHRGADFGNANQEMRQGQFEFVVTETGWHLVPVK